MEYFPGHRGHSIVATEARDLNDMLVSLHRGRFTKLGLEESGLYIQYKFQLDQDAIVRQADIPVAQLIVDKLPRRYDRYVITHGALGEFGFLLATCGLNVTICESQPMRFRAMEAGLGELRKTRPDAAAHCRLANIPWQELPSKASGSMLVALYSVVAPDLDAARERDIVQSVTGYDGLLIVPRTFLCIRDSEAEQRRAEALITAVGFGPVRRFRDVIYFEKGITKDRCDGSDDGAPVPKPVEARVEAEIIAFMREELSAYGEEQSGLGTWYRNNHLDRGRGFSPYSSVIADFLENYRADFASVTEIGAGIGQVCIHLATRGWKTVAIENYFLRYEMMERLIDRIGRNVDERIRCRVLPRQIFFPNHRESYIDSHTVVLIASIGASVDLEMERRMFASFSAAGGVLLDLRIFFTTRERGVEQDALVAKFRAAGFAPPVEVWDWPGEPGGFMPHRFVFFRRLPS